MSMPSRPAALFLSHGGGPGFFMKGRSGGFSQMNAESPAAEWYRTFTKQWAKPSAIVVISAHWEERGSIRVTSGAKHALLYDYYGFPAHTYELGYDCPGEPVLANRIVRMLQEDGIPAKGNTARGYDHGVFIPLKLMYPDADIPVVQVSLLAGLSPEKHLKIGSALRTLAQEQDILIVGSGQATHNMASYPGYAQGEAAPREAEFMDWLKDTATNASVSPEERRRRLLEWEKAPYARLAHPREEHLLPMHVVSGCTDFAPGKVIYDDFVMGAMSLACVGFWGPDGEGEQGEGKDADGEKEKVDDDGADKVDDDRADKVNDDGADKVADGLAVCSV